MKMQLKGKHMGLITAEKIGNNDQPGKWRLSCFRV